MIYFALVLDRTIQPQKKRMKTRFLFMMVLFCLEIQTFAQNSWYVATTGSNSTGNGSLANPYATIQYALYNWALQPGDSVIVRGGNYISDEIRIDMNDITLKSYPGEWAVITASVLDEEIASCIYYHNVDLVGGTLERLEIVGGYYYGIKTESDWNWGNPIPMRHGSSAIAIRNCKIHDTGRDCIKIVPASDNIVIENCEIYNSGIGPANLPINNGPNAEGIDVVNADNLVVKNCYLHNLSTTGIYSKGGSINTLIEGNLVIGTGNMGILLGFYTDEEWFDTIANPLFYENLNGIVRNNIIINSSGEGLGMYGAYKPAVYNNTVINCGWGMHGSIFYNTGYMWLNSLNDMYAVPCRDVFVQNNVIVQHDSITTPVEYIRYYDNIPGTNMLGNCNINHNRFYRPSGIYFIKSTWWQNLSLGAWRDTTGYDMNSWEGNPFLDNNYHLTATSPCINTAYPVSGLVYDYDGGTRTNPTDVGADEYLAGAILTIPPPAGVIGAGGHIPTIPATGFVANQTLQNGQVRCYNATQTITVAGTGAPFVVNTGGSGTFIAGQNIIYLPGTKVDSGGYLLGYITMNGQYCGFQAAPAMMSGVNWNDEKIISAGQSLFKIYPNPTSGSFFIEITGSQKNSEATIEIIGMRGDKVFSFALNDENKRQFSLTGSPAGVYFVRLISETRTETAKIVHSPE